MKAIEEWYANKTDRQVNEFDEYDLHICKVVEEYASQSPEPNKPLRVPFPDDFLKERNRKVEEMKSWSWQYDEGWSDCEDWLRLNQKKFDKEFVDEVEAMISASPEPNTVTDGEGWISVEDALPPTVETKKD